MLNRLSFIARWRLTYLPIFLAGLVCRYFGPDELFDSSMLMMITGISLALASELLNSVFKISTQKTGYPWSSMVGLSSAVIFRLLLNNASESLCEFVVAVNALWFLTASAMYKMKSKARLANPAASSTRASNSAQTGSKSSSEQLHYSVLNSGAPYHLLYRAEAKKNVNETTEHLEALVHSGLFRNLKQGAEIKSVSLSDLKGESWHGMNLKSTHQGTAVLGLELKLPDQSSRLMQIRIQPTKQDASCFVEVRWHGGSGAAAFSPQSFEYQLAHFFVAELDKRLHADGLISYSIDSELHAASFSQSKARHESKRASWPNAQDFCEAIQNPQTSFEDPELKESLVELNLLGLPRATSGMFATVFEMKLKEKRWAIRCFNEDPGDNQERYSQISKFILADDLPYTIDFDFQERGIKVNSSHYPVLKMDWVEGETLDLYIEKKLQNKSCLKELQTKFRVMLEKLQETGIAHGDLQHGNILISKVDIYLVDYDAFFVPGLEGKGSKELGHANYQHPKRDASDFGPYLDNFSARVIDLSLSALVEEAELWHEFRGGDECLLFRRRDFVQGKASSLFTRLLNHRSSRLKEDAAALLDCLNLDLTEIPPLHLAFQTQTKIRIEQKEKVL